MILGSNGSGKSTIGIKLAEAGAIRIGARRALDLPRNQRQVAQADPVATKVREFATNRTGLQHDLFSILRELHLEEQRLAMDLRRATVEQTQPPTDVGSRFDVVRRLWHTLFPGRTLRTDMDDWTVTSQLGNRQNPYSQNDMSDGERQALYVLSKVALANDGDLIVIDEPETHLHPVLARRLWDALEAYRPASRFVYITHDLLFASSRHDAVLVVCRPDRRLERVDLAPEDLTTELIGAASLPMLATQVVFCEGALSSHDFALLDAWYAGLDAAVIPVGGCDDVVKSVASVKRLGPVRAAVSGVVDRDVRCDAEIATLTGAGLNVLGVAEVEHLYALPGIVSAVLKHLGSKGAELTNGAAHLEDALKKW